MYVRIGGSNLKIAKILRIHTVYMLHILTIDVCRVIECKTIFS